MSCERCGYSACYSSHSCPRCNRGPAGAQPMTMEQAQAIQSSIDNVFRFLFKAIGALFLHPIVCFAGFWLLGYGAIMSLPHVFGLAGMFGETANTAPDWYHYGALGVPVLLAIALRKYVPLFMKWAFFAALAALAGLVIYKLTSGEEPASQPAAAAVAAPAPRTAEPDAAQRALRVQRALQEAATPETTATAPGEDTGPQELFEGVSLRICEMGYGGIEVCQRYCATLESADQPEWCHAP